MGHPIVFVRFVSQVNEIKEGTPQPQTLPFNLPRHLRPRQKTKEQQIIYNRNTIPAPKCSTW